MSFEPGLVSRFAAPGLAGADVRDEGQEIALHPAEAGLVAASAAGRQRDFALGRFCARAAMARLGLAPVPIARGATGAPLWPADVAGSITHTRGYAAALVASRQHFRAVGLDAERIGGVTQKLMPRLFDSSEIAWMLALEPERRDTALTVFFSAKEAYYKAWNPLTCGRPSFRDIHIAWEGERITATQPGDAANSTAQGQVVVSGDLVVSCILLPWR